MKRTEFPVFLFKRTGQSVVFSYLHRPETFLRNLVVLQSRSSSPVKQPPVPALAPRSSAPGSQNSTTLDTASEWGHSVLL